MKFRERAQQLWQENDYHCNIEGLGLGLCEEAGEVAKAINVHHNPSYVSKKPKEEYSSVEDELRDILIYAAHICNMLDLDLDF